MVVMIVMLMRMRVRHSVMGMFVAMLCARRRWIRMRVVMVPVVMGMLMRMCDGVVCVRVRMLCHRFLPIFRIPTNGPRIHLRSTEA